MTVTSLVQPVLARTCGISRLRVSINCDKGISFSEFFATLRTYRLVTQSDSSKHKVQVTNHDHGTGEHIRFDEN